MAKRYLTTWVSFLNLTKVSRHNRFLRWLPSDLQRQHTLTQSERMLKKIKSGVWCSFVDIFWDYHKCHNLATALVQIWRWGKKSIRVKKWTIQPPAKFHTSDWPESLQLSLFIHQNKHGSFIITNMFFPSSKINLRQKNKYVFPNFYIKTSLKTKQHLSFWYLGPGTSCLFKTKRWLT